MLPQLLLEISTTTTSTTNTTTTTGTNTNTIIITITIVILSLDLKKTKFLSHDCNYYPRKVQTTPFSSQLYWLPVKEQINFKLALLSWKALNLKQPMYMSELLTRRRDSCSRHLRDHGSLDSNCVPKRIGEGAFGMCTPHLWNTLPETITSSSTL